MTSARVFPLSLDAKTERIIKQIPKGFKSQVIRLWIQRGAEEDDFTVFTRSTKTKPKRSGEDLIISQVRKLRR